MRKTDITFNCEKNVKSKYQLASGYISQTTILFEKEQVIAVIQAKGDVAFYNMDDELIASGNARPMTDGRQVYEDVCCQVANQRIKLQFPVYKWIDNYPNCDGEYDRWDSVIVGYHALELDLLTGTIVQ